MTISSESNILEDVKETILYQAMTEGFITDDTATLDSAHFEAKDNKAPPKEENQKQNPRNAGVNQKKKENNG